MGNGRIFASHDVDCAEFGHLSFVKACERGIGLEFVKFVVGRIVDNFLHILNAVLAEVQFCHS